MKKIKLNHLQHSAFQGEGSSIEISIWELWMDAIDLMGQHLVAGSNVLRVYNKGDLNKRALGLAPALLQEICLDCYTLRDNFAGLAEQMKNQIQGFNRDCQHGRRRENCKERGCCNEGELEESDRKSLREFADFNWRMHTFRAAVLHEVCGSKRSQAERDWLPAPLPSAVDTARRKKTLYDEAAEMILENEAKLNHVLSMVKRDFSCDEENGILAQRVYAEYALQDKADNQKTASDKRADHPDLRDLFQAVIDTESRHSVASVWKQAWDTEDVYFRDKLQSDEPGKPPCMAAVRKLL